MKDSERCLSCNSSNVEQVLLIENLPAHCNLLWDSREEALNCPKGNIRLNFCHDCGHLYNQLFDDSLMHYSQEYENALDFSRVFQEYSRDLVHRLVDTYNLRSKDIVEIGCGKGDFLKMICEYGKNRGYGFDKSYNPQLETEIVPDSIKFFQDFYSDKYAGYSADLIVSRHVLEHISNPTQFLSGLKSVGENNVDTLYYFEVPNILYTLRDEGIWDLIYEHCSYYNSHSISNLFSRLGFNIISVQEDYNGQFLSIEASSNNVNIRDFQLKFSYNSINDLVKKFSQVFNKKINSWKMELDDLFQQGKKVVIWGGGSKGVSFLNFLGTSDKINEIVDINPRKKGKFIAGTGQEYILPNDLVSVDPDVIIIMNPIYLEEIKRTLHEMKLTTKILVA